MVYPPIANINTANALSSYTVSMWLKTNNTGNTFSTFFGIVPSGITDLWGAIDMSAETGWFQPGAGDTLVLKTNYGSLKLDGSMDGQDNRPDPKGVPPVGVFHGAGRWIHFVARWDQSTHKLQVFGDGVSIGAYDLRASSGPLVLKTPAQAVVGSLPHNDIGFAGVTGTRGDWMPMATAAIDDIRVYNTAILDKDITALFNLGTAGR